MPPTQNMSMPIPSWPMSAHFPSHRGKLLVHCLPPVASLFLSCSLHKAFWLLPSTHSPSLLPLPQIDSPNSNIFPTHSLLSSASRMRRLFGQKGGKQPSSSLSASPSPVKNPQNGTPKKRRPFSPFLRGSLRKLKSSSTAFTNSYSIDERGGQNGAILPSSRTFDVPIRSFPPNNLLSDRFCPSSLSPAPSACHSEPTQRSSINANATDGQLDRSLMQTCTDVKYENRRKPKFAAVVDANFQRQCLQAHNYVRQIYASPPLLWSQELAELAKTWALKLTQRGRMLYPELPGIGENIFLLSANATTTKSSTGDHLTTGNELVAHWAAEASNLDFGHPKWSQGSRHFTQMIWRGSTEMGVARHWNTANDCLAIVAFYRPAGNCNLPGEFGANLPSLDEVPQDALTASNLAALCQALNRSDLGDGGFRKSPVPASPRNYSCPPNSTKILKC